MDSFIVVCRRCGFVNPPTSHYGSTICHARMSVAHMERQEYARLPDRRWKRAFKKAGIPVVHGPISTNAQGNWAPKQAIDMLYLRRRDTAFKRLPFHLQVEAVAWWMKRRPQPPTVNP